MKLVFSLNGKKITAPSLKYKSKEDQLEIMRNWFYENYEDPVNACPYDGREGGYAYIYGGPYDAGEELQFQFEKYVKLNYIEELAGELQQDCWEWSGNSNNIDNWYDEDLYRAVISSDDPLNKFNENIRIIKSLKEGEYEQAHKEHLLNILFTNVITALETLYVELFIKSIDKKQYYIGSLISNGKTEFKVSKQTLALPFKGEGVEKFKDEITKSIKEHLISASWHNTNQVLLRYKAAFGIKVQDNWPLSEIESAILTRNHLVHRGGKDKDGKMVTITDQVLDSLLFSAMTLARKLYDSLDEALQNKNDSEESEF